MDATTYALVGAVVVLALLVTLLGRRRRDRSLRPVRLGPAWSPPSGGHGGDIGASALLGEDERVERLRERTELEEETVATVVLAWDELGSLHGRGTLPRDHHYRIYDPYDPPVTTRGADGQPIADPARVARDVDARTPVAEVDARTVLTALLEDLDGPPPAEAAVAPDRGRVAPGDEGGAAAPVAGVRDVADGPREPDDGPASETHPDVATPAAGSFARPAGDAPGGADEPAGFGDAAGGADEPAGSGDTAGARDEPAATGDEPAATGGEPASHVRLAPRPVTDPPRERGRVDDLDAADDELFGRATSDADGARPGGPDRRA